MVVYQVGQGSQGLALADSCLEVRVAPWQELERNDCVIGARRLSPWRLMRRPATAHCGLSIPVGLFILIALEAHFALDADANVGLSAFEWLEQGQAAIGGTRAVLVLASSWG